MNKTTARSVLRNVYGEEDLLVSAGRKVLCGFLSVALTTTLVPTTPFAACALAHEAVEAGQADATESRGFETGEQEGDGRHEGEDHGQDVGADCKDGEPQDEDAASSPEDGQRPDSTHEDGDTHEAVILRIADVLNGGQAVCSGGMYASGTFTVALGEAVEVDYDNTFLRLYGEDDVVTDTVFVRGDKGRAARTETLTFACDDGSYKKIEFAVQDIQGETDRRFFDGIVVDTEAPLVLGSLSNAPVFVADNDEGGEPVAFFDETTTLFLRFCDATSGVASVEDVPGLEMDRVYSESHELVEAALELPEGTFADDVEFVVRDRAGNQSTWSMKSAGARVVAGVEVAVQNQPLVKDWSEELISYDGHPSKVITDTEMPSLAFDGVDEGAHVNRGQVVTLTATDANFGYVAVYDASQPIATVSKDGVDVSALTQLVGGYEDPDLAEVSHVYRWEFPVDAKTHEDDGVYRIDATLRDLAGNAANGGDAETRTFVVDTVSPVLHVTFDDEGPGERAAKGRYRQQVRTAHIVVADKNLSVLKLNEDRLVSVVRTARDGHAAGDVAVGSWHEGDAPDEYCCDVVFPADGTYSLAVFGADEAGNVLVGGDGTTVDDAGRYESGEFVVDSTLPQVSFEYAGEPSAARRYDGLDYFRHPVTVCVTVTDRNLDVARTIVTDSEGREFLPQWEVAGRTEDGVVAYTASLVYREEETGTGSGRKTPHVRVADLAGNSGQVVLGQFVVDQTAPQVDGVRMSKSPASEGSTGPGEDPYQFFNERDGIPTLLTFDFSDEYLVEAAWVEDPDGVYDMWPQSDYHQPSGSLTIELKDHEENGGEQDVDYERNVRLHVRDVAGNTRSWTIDRTGAVVADRTADERNASLNGSGIYPMALIKDTTAPAVTLSGVEEGRFYNTGQTAHIVVNEHNFEYLLRFDPNRVLVTVDRQEGVEGRASSSWAIRASEFEGSRPNYVFDQTFEADGHYSLAAAFDDYAGNPARAVGVGEFTIDKTAPVLTVTWDNDDVRNGMYYRAYRTATVMVVEHNFDPTLFSIDTTGSVGAWESSGDTHSCTVSFAVDAPASRPHRLAVRGKDKAGNEAAPYTASDFAIDTQEPAILFRKCVSEQDRMVATSEESELVDGSAFSQAIVPMVEVSDEASLDVHGIEATLVGRRGGSVSTMSFGQNVTQMGQNRVRIDWGNLGLSADEGEGYYQLSADDVYTLMVKAVDLAGNASGEQSVTFSVNRYGSNYFFEDTGGLTRNDDGSWDLTPLTSAPRIVVHEVNVSGIEDGGGPEGEDSRAVTKEYANATSPIQRTAQAEERGYTLSASTDISSRNPYGGWTEYVYTIQAGNFGKGSDSDYGDGGQGIYRVDVSSIDKAQNNNTTAAYWESGAARTVASGQDDGPDVPKDKTATVFFTLDEDGPQIKDVDVPEGLCVGDGYEASFRVVDQITNGNRLVVTVDGRRVEVRREGSSKPLGEGDLTQQGTYLFTIPAASVFDSREVEIHVSDYTGLEERSQTVRAGGFRLSTLVAETTALFAVCGAGVGAYAVARRRRDAAEPDVASVVGKS